MKWSVKLGVFVDVVLSSLVDLSVLSQPIDYLLGIHVLHVGPIVL